MVLLQNQKPQKTDSFNKTKNNIHTSTQAINQKQKHYNRVDKNYHKEKEMKLSNENPQKMENLFTLHGWPTRVLVQF